jgi:methylmalonyl-CoA mutase N-terminal domain/subunit
VTVQALAAALGGTQSLHTNAFDEALALPTEASATLALRTQQVLAFESGVTRAVDPLAGSWYVEHLTDRIEAEARQLIEEVDALGGAAAAVEAGFFQRAIADSAWTFQQAQEAGDITVVGVNRFTDQSVPTVVPAPDYGALEREQRARLDAVKQSRDAGAVAAALEAVRRAAVSDAGMMAPILAAVRVRATIGEISDAMRLAWGVYHGGNP